jgi:hypothetical protein
MLHVILASGWIERLPALLAGDPRQIPVAHVPAAGEDDNDRLAGMGFPVIPLPLAELSRDETQRRLHSVRLVYVTGENVPGFADLVSPLVRAGDLTYVGVGAGAILAGPEALGLVPFTVASAVPLSDGQVIDVWDTEWRVLSSAGGPLSVDDVARLAMELPEVTETERRGCVTWAVRGKAFAWDRPFSKADLRRFGEVTPPDGPVIAVQVADLHEKEAVLAAKRPGVFTISHFDGYAAVLIQLNVTDLETLRELLTDGWLAKAPPELAR